MQLPFTVAQFFDVFRQYNESVWPAQIALVALALAAIALLVFHRPWSGAGISAILSFLWLWIGVAYHIAFFSSVNQLAYVFAAVSVAGGAAFAWHGVFRRRLEFSLSRSLRSLVGLVLIVFALAVYPLWAAYAGHVYPAMPSFGLPCPTTIFTIGMLSFLVAPYPRAPLVAPVLWCFVGSQAALLLSVPQDLALVVAGIVGVALAVRSRPSSSEWKPSP